MLTLEISMVVCITSPNFWTWKFPWPFWINSKVLTLEISIANFRCTGIRCSANPRLFFYTKSIHLLQFKIIFDISSHSWHDDFFSGNNWCQPPNFLQIRLCKKEHDCKQNLAPFSTPYKNRQFWQSFLIILPLSARLSKIAYIKPFFRKKDKFNHPRLAMQNLKSLLYAKSTTLFGTFWSKL